MLDLDYDTLQQRMTSCTGYDNARTVSLEDPDWGRRNIYGTFSGEIRRLGSMHLLGRVLKMEWMVQ